MRELFNYITNISVKTNISIITIVMFFTFIFIIVFKKSQITSVDSEILSLIIGALLTKVSTIYDYHFGSSQGSADKTKVIDKLTDNK